MYFSTTHEFLPDLPLQIFAYRNKHLKLKYERKQFRCWKYNFLNIFENKKLCVKMQMFYLIRLTN